MVAIAACERPQARDVGWFGRRRTLDPEVMSRVTFRPMREGRSCSSEASRRCLFGVLGLVAWAGCQDAPGSNAQETSAAAGANAGTVAAGAAGATPAAGAAPMPALRDAGVDASAPLATPDAAA